MLQHANEEKLEAGRGTVGMGWESSTLDERMGGGRLKNKPILAAAIGISKGSLGASGWRSPASQSGIESSRCGSIHS